MESSIESNVEQKNLELITNALNHLAETRKWTMFLSIAGFVFMGIMFIAFIGILGKDRGFGMVLPPAFTLLPLILIIAVYFFPIYFLYQFSSFSNKALKNSDSVMLATALRFLKLHYKFMGILFIVFMSIYLIIILIVISTGTFLHLFN